ncbi:prepilin-type N-terminal cleavage/methylation domain-containing protein [Desulfocurvibacter africanus PCS]|uniref:Prepilin-type N-terminal cleavage/methylation domain-containing protein n=1 Tax=Desulfocurvibacter africanus PCS TaxID=1262666 RepID=M5Q365_DESAF|nr:prepilin-type N-terminal cleavage/methylation domain-containing protein [Desulfocurvibacter africanus]EMG39091.1 prepilin-type N-terminal cleavage/methylation domain-containing protein [Desulfocurvibacter africanus PCS]
MRRMANIAAHAGVRGEALPLAAGGYSRLEANRVQAGFTLLEVVISLTILSLLMLVLYMAFSTAATVWSRTGDGDSPKQRQETVSRLLADDFRGLRPYTLNWEQGRDFAFAGAKGAVFYVTTGGLGSTDRADHGLFFACLFLAPEERTRPGRDSAQALYLYKSPYPDEDYFLALHDFATSTGDTRASWLPPESMRERSRLLLGHLGEAAFSFSAGAAILPEEQDASPFAASRLLPEEDWAKQSLPAVTQLEYALDGQVFRALAMYGGLTE